MDDKQIQEELKRRLPSQSIMDSYKIPKDNDLDIDPDAPEEDITSPSPAKKKSGRSAKAGRETASSTTLIRISGETLSNFDKMRIEYFNKTGSLPTRSAFVKILMKAAKI